MRLWIISIVFIFSSCTHIELVKWQADTFEVCCTGKCTPEKWAEKNAQICSGEVELIGGENRSEIIGINTHRHKHFSHSTLNSRESQCRNYTCKGKITSVN